jgi:putative ABC transport system permease protein
MNPLLTLRVAVRALFRNKLRSFLTMLGVIIGVGAVIAMVSVGEGAKSQVEAAFASMGSNLLMVMSGSTTSGGSRGGFGSMPTLTWDDLDAIQTEVPTVHYACPFLRTSAAVMSEEQNWTTQINGTTPDYFAIRSWKVVEGELFTESDVTGATKVAVLGQTVVEKLFGSSSDPIGRTVRIKNIPFQVIGVLDKKGQSAMGQDYDDAVVIPVRTYMTKVSGALNRFISGQIMVSATSSDTTTRAQASIIGMLRDRHRLKKGQDDDFSVLNLTEMANAQEEGTKTMTSLLASIAIVSLVVGGIGIMNIMLVSVTERTREIGLRMAIGAKPRHILAQFLIEAMVLSVMGGLTGLCIGLGVATWLGNSFGWPILIRADIVVIAIGFSALVGIVFGLYPARMASLLHPIDALRYE